MSLTFKMFLPVIIISVITIIYIIVKVLQVLMLIIIHLIKVILYLNLFIGLRKQLLLNMNMSDFFQMKYQELILLIIFYLVQMQQDVYIG